MALVLSQLTDWSIGMALVLSQPTDWSIGSVRLARFCALSSLGVIRAKESFS